jgi:hypothetical protein
VNRNRRLMRFAKSSKAQEPTNRNGWNHLGCVEDRHPDSGADGVGSVRAARGTRLGMRWRSQTNFLPWSSTRTRQSMKVDNYLASDTKETANPWEWWQRNKMDARQTGIIRSALTYGVGYVDGVAVAEPAWAARGRSCGRCRRGR